MKPPPRVALLIESSRTYGRSILRGIAGYTRIQGGWSVFWQERELHSGIPGWLKTWQGDGIIARIENPRMARELLRLKIPVVDVLGNDRYESIPGLDTDADAVAKLFSSRPAFSKSVSAGIAAFRFQTGAKPR